MPPNESLIEAAGLLKALLPQCLMFAAFDENGLIKFGPEQKLRAMMERGLSPTAAADLYYEILSGVPADMRRARMAMEAEQCHTSS